MPPSQSKTKNAEIWGGGGGALIPSPKAVGLECVPPSFILLMLPLQMPCSLVVAKLMSNSCAPPPLSLPDSGKFKREPQSLKCCCAGAYLIGLGVNEKVQNTGVPMPNCFLGVGFIVF